MADDPGPPPPCGQCEGPADVPAFGACRPRFGRRRLWRLADLRLPGRLLLRHLLASRFPGPYDVEAEGLRFRTWPGENHDDRVIFTRRRLPDREEREALAPHLPDGGVFVDVGANIGSYALWAARHVGPRGRVIACEPHPALRARLAANARLSRLEHLEIVPAAVGAAAGEAELHPSGGGNLGQTSLHRDVTFRPSRPLRVPVRPLAAILAGLRVGRIDVLKLDVEGYEDRVLGSYLDDAPIEALPGAILLETSLRHRWSADVVERLGRLGYHPVMQTSDNLVLRRKA